MTTETNTAALTSAINTAVARDGVEVLPALERLSDAAGFAYEHDPQEYVRSMQIVLRETNDTALIAAVADAVRGDASRPVIFAAKALLDAAVELLDV